MLFNPRGEKVDIMNEWPRLRIRMGEDEMHVRVAVVRERSLLKRLIVRSKFRRKVSEATKGPYELE